MSEVKKFKQFKVWRKSWNNGKGYDESLGKENVSKSYTMTVVDERDGYWILEDGKRAKIDERNIVKEVGSQPTRKVTNDEQQVLWDEYNTLKANNTIDPEKKEIKRKEILKKINDLKRGDRKPADPEVKKLWDQFHKIKKDPNLTDEEKQEKSSAIVKQINDLKRSKTPQISQNELHSNQETQSESNIDADQFSVQSTPSSPVKGKVKPKKSKGEALDI